MSNIPERVKVAGVTYEVKQVSNLLLNYDLLGQAHYLNSEIQIDSSLSDERKEQIFVHELLHAIFKESGYDEQDEDTINRLAITLHQVLKDNDLKIYKEW